MTLEFPVYHNRLLINTYTLQIDWIAIGQTTKKTVCYCDLCPRGSVPEEGTAGLYQNVAEKFGQCNKAIFLYFVHAQLCH